MKLTTNDLRTALLNAADKMEEHKDELTDLDREIGDGDHGINMSRGFQAVKKELEAKQDFADLGELSKLVGMTLIKTVGGASGPLYGTIFVKFANTWKGVGEAEGDALVSGFEEALEGIKTRGKADAGEKTMIDVWTPFINALKSEGDLSHAIDEGLAHSKTIMATKGRASYFGEATKGVQDPGALSSSLLLNELKEALHD
ncbi:dihydroxyacetone kinase subunit DhaL [Exiguobacterium flavidum]|uniref:dihydroxyacetone kinase subunit DhaL n=1 Tax=Exiguobacterium flavidum TaxID=2184695 RepID=UPI000DF7CD3F|nr:dihydroxyacetone kinase subunit DhaL [Exiguobacterium flavidum]